jgi:hypothetical protein
MATKVHADGFADIDDPETQRWAEIRAAGKRHYVLRYTALLSLGFALPLFFGPLIFKALGFGNGYSTWAVMTGFGLFWLALTVFVSYAVFASRWDRNERAFSHKQT